MEYTGFIIFLLVFVRIISFLGSSPIFMIKGIPNLLKVGLAIILTYLIFNFVSYNPALVPGSLIALGSMAVGECIFGLALGFMTSLFIEGIRVSGQLMDLQIGFSMINEYNSLDQTNITVLGNVSHLLGIVIFFMIDGHHMLIQSLIQSFQVIPVLGMQIPPEVGPYMLSIFIKVMILAVKLAAPIVVVLFLTDFTLGLIARTVPQLNVFMMSMPIKILVGLLVLSAILPGLVQMYIKAFEGMPKDIDGFFRLFPLVMVFAANDKTEEPTSKRIEDARKKGQVAKSREFISACTLIGVTIFVASMGNYGLQNLQEFLTKSLNNIGKEYIAEGDLVNILTYNFIEFMKITLPFFAVVIVTGVIANVIQTGFLFTNETLKPKLSTLNPIEGFKRMFSGRAYMQLLRSFVSIAIVGYATYSLLKSNLFTVLKISDMSLNALYEVPRSIVQSELVRVSLVIGILGIIDFIYQKRAYKKDLRMTKQEVKEEFKQMEGDPQIRSRIRQKQREMASRRMMHEVPKATVVVTNPTHLAIALKYEHGKNGAPVVVAKGADLLAARIKKIAKENNVPIIENRPVARALYEKVEINESIPVELYQAVAQILAVVYSLNKKTRR